MKRYSEVPWPWAGLTIALVLLAQEALLKFVGDSPSLLLTSWRIMAMTIGVTSLALIILPPRRPAYFLGALTCAGLMAWALWLQYGLGLDPCPLCSVQRLCVIAIGIVFLVAGVHNPRRLGAGVYAGLTVIVGLFGAATAMRHVWIQSLPKGEVPECGMGLNYMLETLPLTDVLTKVFKGSGECAEKAWMLFGLAIPSWTFVFYVAMIVAAFALIRRD
jgi:disulfide bond formation protein DsbB